MSMHPRTLVFLPLVLQLAATAAAQWSTAQLSAPREFLAATAVGEKALFAGGLGPITQSTVVDIYDDTTGTWSVASLSAPRERLAAVTVGDRAYFAGGFGPTGWSDVVDVYDSATGSWSVLHMPSALDVQLMNDGAKIVGAAAQTKALFTGGSVVHVLETTTQTWTSTSIAAPLARRDTVVAASVGQKALFAGGNVQGLAASLVDVYDASTGTWSQTWLSVARGEVSAVTVGQQVVFAGGNAYSFVGALARFDVYDDVTGSWSRGVLPTRRTRTVSAAVGSKVVLVGGLGHFSPPTTVADVFDLSTGLWTQSGPIVARLNHAVATVGGKALFAGGSAQTSPSATVLDVVEIYEESIGVEYCNPAAPNSTGMSAQMSASGSTTVASNDLTIQASRLPLGTFGYFLTSATQGLVANPGGSQGDLCLTGQIGRYNGPGQILTSGTTGAMALTVDLQQHPTPTGFVMVQPGQTWNFQCWYRDAVAGGGATSNFTDGLEVLFTSGGGVPIPAMVPIPAGTFSMGSRAPSSEPYFNGPEQQPVHQVTISYPYWMGQHEVTQGEYRALIGTNPSYFLDVLLPVERVSWHEARAYCSALTAYQAGNIPAGYEYRLPTEAEWEYACRAGTTTEFHYGADLFCNEARFSFSHHSSMNCNIILYYGSGTVDVGSYAPNAFGLYDMHGNVGEWCLDSYAPYSAAAVTDPFVTGGAHRVLRGGSWYSYSDTCRSAKRGNLDPGDTNDNLGFRVVLAPALVP